MDNLSLNVGIIGAGNMGSALAKGIAASGILVSANMYINDVSNNKAEALAKEIGANFVPLEVLAEKSHVIIIAVKPDSIISLLENIKTNITCCKIIVSVAAGVTVNNITKIIGNDKKVIRVMPNTAALVSESMSAICLGGTAANDDLEKVCHLFSCVGKTCLIPETKMDAAVGIAGSSPAFIFQVIEAMSDAGVRVGLSRQEAIQMSAQAVLGAAKMVLETGCHPAQLKDMVTSPGGTTIEGVYQIEKGGVRTAFIDAITAAVEKSKTLSKQ